MSISKIKGAFKSKKEAFKNKKKAIRGKIDSKRLATSLKKDIAKEITAAFNSNDKFILDWPSKTTTKAIPTADKEELTVVLTLDKIPINSGIISKLANNAVDCINNNNPSKLNWSNFEVTPYLEDEKNLKIAITCQTLLGSLQ